jgi:hypothetical protein
MEMCKKSTLQIVQPLRLRRQHSVLDVYRSNCIVLRVTHRPLELWYGKVIVIHGNIFFS